MTQPPLSFQQRADLDLLDSYDEELEMELDDDRLDALLLDGPQQSPSTEGAIDRRLYFRELFRLQGELVKLQDWVVKPLGDALNGASLACRIAAFKEHNKL